MEDHIEQATAAPGERRVLSLTKRLERCGVCGVFTWRWAWVSSNVSQPRCAEHGGSKPRLIP